MKNFFYCLLLLVFFVLILSFPNQTFIGASNGLLLWFQTILPTLLPFIILSNLLVNTGSIHYITKLFGPLISRLFHISESSSHAVLMGFLTGYPMGAKTINDLIKCDYITTNEGRYLLSFCNNASPMFIISFIVSQNFSDLSYTLGTLCILILSPVLCSFIFRKFYNLADTNRKAGVIYKNSISFDFEILDVSIMNAFETITKIGGYIIIFSILCKYVENSPLKYFTPILELSTGIPSIMNWNCSFTVTYTLVLALTSFGGLCAIAQTGGMIKESRISLAPYITQKLITALVTSFLAYVYICFIHQ